MFDCMFGCTETPLPPFHTPLLTYTQPRPFLFLFSPALGLLSFVTPLFTPLAAGAALSRVPLLLAAVPLDEEVEVLDGA